MEKKERKLLTTLESFGTEQEPLLLSSKTEPQSMKDWIEIAFPASFFLFSHTILYPIWPIVHDWQSDCNTEKTKETPFPNK